MNLITQDPQPINPAYLRSDGIPVYSDEHGEYCRVPLSRNQFARVDADEATRVFPWVWSAQWSPGSHRFRAHGRVRVNGAWKQIYLHRFIMNDPPGRGVDHIDGDQLNDRKYNLRLSTQSQNLSNRPKQKNNTTGFKGVHWDKKRQKFTSQIQARGVLYHLGAFNTAEEAYAAYCEAGKRLHEEFFCVDEIRDGRIDRSCVSSVVRDYEAMIGRRGRGKGMLQERPKVTQPDNPNHRLIALTRGQVALVDAKNYEELMRWSWCAAWSEGTQSFYAVRGGGISMARHIMKAQKGTIVDHFNHDTLCNLESNLRVSTHRNNIANWRMRSDNTSGYKGAFWSGWNNKWRAVIRSGNGNRKHLGYFSTAEEAHKAYRKAAIDMYGEFACLG